MYLTGKINFSSGILSFRTVRSNNIIFDKTYKIEDIDNIDIKQDAGDIIFKETSGDDIQVVVYGENESDLDVNLNQNSLSIDNTLNKRNNE